MNKNEKDLENGCCGGGCGSGDSLMNDDASMMDGGCCGGACACSEETTNEMMDSCCGGGCGSEAPTEEYWQDVHKKVLPPEELKAEFIDDAFDSFSIKKSRRSFLKIMGFSVSALPLTGCVKIPVTKAIPYLKKNDTVIPGLANWYATTFNNVPVLLKLRDGRPIKVEGNDLSKTTYGGADAQVQASVLSLYDSSRLRNPRANGKDLEWADFDRELSEALEKAKASGKEIVVVTPTLTSPSQVSVINEFVKSMGGNATHVAYDAVSEYAVVKSAEVSFGSKGLPEYNFLNADLIVSFEADFLGTMRNNLKHSREYAKRRDLFSGKNKLNRHIQIESLMTMTGTNADSRYTKSQKEQREILVGIHDLLAGKNTQGLSLSVENKELVLSLVSELKANKGKSLVLSSDSNVDTQVIVNKINDLLSNIGSTVEFYNSPFYKLGSDEDFQNFLKRANDGKVGAALIIGSNPAYDFSNLEILKTAFSKIETLVTFSGYEDETSKLSKFNAPDNHAFESWSDNVVCHNELSFTQPVIQPLFGTRMAMETLLTAMGKEANFHNYVQNTWNTNFHSKQNKFATAQGSWDQALHDGVIELKDLAKSISKTASSAEASASKLVKLSYADGINLVLYQNVAMKDGKMANNPWLQELPDPVTKATWDNYVMVSPGFAKKNNLKEGDVLSITDGTYTVEAPTLSQPGMDDFTVGLALGYGRSVSGKVGTNLGANAFGFTRFENGAISYFRTGVKVNKTSKFRALAQTQTHHSIEGRDIVRESTLDKWLKNPNAGNEKKAHIVDIYPKHDYSKGHQWAMAIDLNSCNGCSACIISCNAENNIPVVGRQEVINRREMHWMRIDRYYKGDEKNPETVHQPMLCQHCENAPCENVCPVMAIVHSSDGLNQQVYNRCVGTRYCANNCPYKVRRFNWFNYDHSDPFEKMVLNPDVVVRSRGVMEKCSLCIQRIQETKLQAKREGRELRDGEVKTACQQSCPSEAIIFGDKNDPNSKISKYINDARNFVVLGELNVVPRVSYLTKIRNK